MPLLIVTLSGIIEESYQMLVPARAASLLDLLALMLLTLKMCQGQ